MAKLELRKQKKQKKPLGFQNQEVLKSYLLIDCFARILYIMSENSVSEKHIHSKNTSHIALRVGTLTPGH